MDFSQKLTHAQNWMQENSIDGWLLYDWAGSNRLALEFLGLSEGLSRRTFYWIPKVGSPIKIVHAIEASFALSELPGDKEVYFSWSELEGSLKKVIGSSNRVAMEYSPKAALPYVSKVDAGTLDLIRSIGPEVTSSAELIQQFCGILTDEGIEEHRTSMQVLTDSLELVKKAVEDFRKRGELPTEWDLQQVIWNHFEATECETEHWPIVATRENAANAHYCPTEDHSSRLKEGDLLLIDLFCRKKRKAGIYADITQMFSVGGKPTARHLEIFNLVKEAQDAGLSLINSRLKEKKQICGYEVDACVRAVIDAAGYGPYFCHRTGHHIESKLHGDGAHLDSIESKDTRPLLPRTCFSVEPGIYIPGEIGVRLECDVLIHEDLKMEITGGYQESLITI